MNYLQELFQEPGFLGAFLGALITGLIAIFVMTIQIVYDHNKSKKNIRGDYKRTFILFKQHYSRISRSLQNTPYLIDKIVYNKTSPLDVHPGEDNFFFDMTADSIYNNTMELEKLDSYKIPEDIFEEFIKIRNLCGEISSLLQRFKPKKDFDCTKPLEEFMHESEIVYEKIIRYYKDKWKIN